MMMVFQHYHAVGIGKVSLVFELYGSLGDGTIWEKVNRYYNGGDASDEAKKKFIVEWIAACTRPSLTSMVPLRVCEGGIASLDGTRQLRFGSREDITLVVREGVFGMDELLELKEAFKKVMEHALGTDVADANYKTACTEVADAEAAFFKLPANEGATLDDFFVSPGARVLYARRDAAFPMTGHVRAHLRIE